MSFIFRPGMERINAREKAEEIETKLETAEKLEPVKVETEGIDKVAEQIVEEVKPAEEPKVETEEPAEELTVETAVEDADLTLTQPILETVVDNRLEEAQEKIKTLELQLGLKEEAIELLCAYARVSKEELAKALSEHKKLSEITGKVLVTL